MIDRRAFLWAVTLAPVIAAAAVKAPTQKLQTITIQHKPIDVDALGRGIAEVMGRNAARFLDERFIEAMS